MNAIMRLLPFVLCCAWLSACADEDAGREHDTPPSAAPAAPPAPDFVTTLNDYQRTNSRLLVRQVDTPTHAQLDLALYHKNVLMDDPKAYEYTPPPEPVTPQALPFDGLVVMDTLSDRYADTALQDAAQVQPLAWPAVVDRLLEWDFDRAMPLADAAGAVSDHKWADDRPTVPYQDVSLLLVEGSGAAARLWVRIEFEPWVSFLQGIGDEDYDGFAEVYARVRDDLYDADLVAQLTGDYSTKTLDAAAIDDWARVTSGRLYPTYNTNFHQPGERAWLTDESDPALRRTLTQWLDRRPPVVFRGKPHDRWLYFILMTHTP